MANILVVYHSRQLHPRATVTDHLYSFRRFSPHRCAYLNAAAWRVPGYFVRMDLDLILFHYSFISDRTDPPHFRRLCSKVEMLKSHPAQKALIVQDEYDHSDAICEFIEEFGIGHVFSVGAPSEWPKIYRGVDRDAVRFDRVLTGYLDDERVRRIGRLVQGAGERTIDVGYRSWDPWPCLGRHGRLKGEIGRVFKDAASEAGLVADISLDFADGIVGDDWYRFLGRCKYTIGVEGGASVLDRDGSIGACTKRYLEERPDAGFEEVETACFPGADGTLDYVALSPRHLEACATRTCQVLMEGGYNGALRPGEHYIELKKDFSNLAEVLETMRRDDLRQGIVERAYRDVVASGAWSYRSFAEFVTTRALPVSEVSSASPAHRARQALRFLRASVADRTLPVRWYVRDVAKKLLGARRLEIAVNAVKRRGRAQRAA